MFMQNLPKKQEPTKNLSLPTPLPQKTQVLGRGAERHAPSVPSYKRVAFHAKKTLKKALQFRRQGASMGWKLNQPTSDESPWLPKSSSQEYPWDQMPSEGLTCDETLDLVEKDLLGSFVPVQNPYFMGHMTSTIPATVHEADILISYLNQNMVKMETAGGASMVERTVLAWFHQRVYQKSDDYYHDLRSIPSCNVALMVHGGTMGNLTALTIARNHALKNADTIGITEALAKSGYNKAVILSSERCHYSIGKINGILGLGKDQLIKIPVNPKTQKMDTGRLEKTIVHLQSNKTLIIACVAVASSTETGSVDDLEVIADICSRHQIWFHVDAAWGGAYLLSDKLSPILKGVHRADSVVVDGHKLLGLTMGGGMIFFKDPTACQLIRQTSHYVLRDDSADSGRFHLEGSRPFYALKLWMLCQRKGSSGLAKLVEGSHSRARVFENRLAHEDSFVQTTPLETNILTYRWCSPKLRVLLECDPYHPGSCWLFECLDRVQDHIHDLGWSRQLVGFVSKTKLELNFLGKYQKMIVLRAVPSQATTTAWHIKDLLQDQRRAGEAFLASQIQTHIHTLLSFKESLPVHSPLYNHWHDLLESCSQTSSRSYKSTHVTGVGCERDSAGKQ